MGRPQTVLKTESPAPPLLLRVIYFLLFGWWFTGIWINVAWVLNVTVIGLPVGLLMLNRVPQVLTLKPIPSVLEATVQDGKVVYLRQTGVPQRSWFVRLIYFVFIGWWLSLIWSNVAWFLCAIIMGLPLGIWMFNRLPAVTTLMRS